MNTLCHRFEKVGNHPRDVAIVGRTMLLRGIMTSLHPALRHHKPIVGGSAGINEQLPFSKSPHEYEAMFLCQYGFY